MEVVTKSKDVSDRLKVYLDDTQWSEHSKNAQLKKKIKRRTSSNILVLGIFLVNYSCS